MVETDNWKEAAEKVIELKNDNEKRERFIANGLKTVKERFDARRVAKESEKLYKCLLEIK